MADDFDEIVSGLDLPDPIDAEEAERDRQRAFRRLAQCIESFDAKTADHLRRFITLAERTGRITLSYEDLDNKRSRIALAIDFDINEQHR